MTFEGKERRTKYVEDPKPLSFALLRLHSYIHLLAHYLFLPFHRSFMSTLLPPTPETLLHVLTQGEIPSWLATAHKPTFDAFLSETRTHAYVASGSFERVLEVCPDHATVVLSRGVEKHAYGSESDDSDLLGGQEPHERLTAMLPGLARWCHLALEGLPNELVDVRVSFTAYERGIVADAFICPV